MEVVGTVLNLGETRIVGDNFKIREIVLDLQDANPQYPEEVVFQFIKDKCDALDDLPEGTEVKIFFNLKGRSWTDPKTGVKRWFNTLQGWKFEVLKSAPVNDKEEAKKATKNTSKKNEKPDQSEYFTPDEEDDLPF